MTNFSPEVRILTLSNNVALIEQYESKIAEELNLIFHTASDRKTTMLMHDKGHCLSEIKLR